MGYFIAICLTCLVVIFGFAYWFSSAACDAKAVSFEANRFGVVSGCMVKHRGRWLPLNNIRGFDDKG